ncbi:hypothetical protein TNCV_2100191 [Trichonephila clavipes]|nr:hypothetical protein TNCV_2100191 [Trichonephila clavipes]
MTVGTKTEGAGCRLATLANQKLLGSLRGQPRGFKGSVRKGTGISGDTSERGCGAAAPSCSSLHDPMTYISTGQWTTALDTPFYCLSSRSSYTSLASEIATFLFKRARLASDKKTSPIISGSRRSNVTIGNVFV